MSRIGKGLTKADILYYALAYCLRGVKLAVGKRYLKPDLTEEQRYEVAARTIEIMRRRGWAELDEKVADTPNLTGPSRPRD
jgi:hypothetical protein